MRIPFLLFLGTFLLIISGVPDAQANSISESRRQLEEIEKRIREADRDLKQKRENTRSLQADLATVEKESTRLRARVASLEKELVDLQESSKQASADVDRLEKQIESSEGLVRRRLIALYKSGEGGSLRLFFADSTPARAAEDHDFLSRIVRKDREILSEFRENLARREEARRRLEELQLQRRDALAELKQEQETLKKATKLKNELVARAKKEESALGGRLEELKERAARLSALIKELESAPPPKYNSKNVPKDGPFARQKGRLPWPASGSLRVPFGTSRSPELGTMRDSQGIEISTPVSAPVSAIWPGRVIFAKWFKGFGNMIILDHGDGYYSLYAQASRLDRKVGDQVKSGENLAVTGSDGLYFEIRHQGAPLDPAAWLAPRR